MDVPAEPGVPAPRSKEQEAHDGETVVHGPLQPLEPELRAPGQPPAPPQGHSQHSLQEPKGAAGRAPAGPPGGVNTEPREDQPAGVQDGAPEPELAGAPRSPEKPDAGDAPGQGQDLLGGGSQDRNKSHKEAAAAGAHVPEAAGARGAGAGAGDPPAQPQQVSQDRRPAGLPSRSEGAAPVAQAGLQQPEHRAVSARAPGGHPEAKKEALGGDHVPAPRQDDTAQEPKQKPDPELGPQQAVPGAQKLDNVKPNRDLKVQVGADLRRRRRDVAPVDEGLVSNEGVIVSFDSLHNVQVGDLRSALDAQLRQAAGGALRVGHSRQLRELPGAPEEA